MRLFTAANARKLGGITRAPRRKWPIKNPHISHFCMYILRTFYTRMLVELIKKLVECGFELMARVAAKYII